MNQRKIQKIIHPEFIVTRRLKKARHKIHGVEELYFYLADVVWKVRDSAQMKHASNRRERNFARKKRVDEADLVTEPVTPFTIVSTDVEFFLYTVKRLKVHNGRCFSDFQFTKETTLRNILLFYYPKQTARVFPLSIKKKS